MGERPIAISDLANGSVQLQFGDDRLAISAREHAILRTLLVHRVDAGASPAALQGDFEPACGTEGLASADEQNRLLAGIEARLTDEMRGLAGSLNQFALRTKAIREEIPDSAKFCKLVSGFFPLAAFHFSEALLSGTQRFTFEDDGALYLQKLGLEIQDFVRELDLEGRKFLAIAFLDKGGRDFLDSAANGDEL